MIAGHAALAFAIVASVATLTLDRRRALLLGAAAGAFAVVPDVDMVFAVGELLASGATGVWSATAAFWDGANAVHRNVTHSLVLSVPAAVGFALVAARRRLAAAAVLSGVVAVGVVSGGATATTLLVVFTAAGVAVAVAFTRLGVTPRGVLIGALVGLLSHPFGDVFTGKPPQFLYPLDVQLLSERVVIHPDPTLNLLSIFVLELAAIWLAVLALGWTTENVVRSYADPRAAVGALYGGAAVVLPAPTLDVSYHFVFSVLAVGFVGAPLSRAPERRQLARAGVTGLVAVTLGVLAFGAVYAVY